VNEASDPAASDDFVLRRLYDYWRERRGTRAFPSVSDIEAGDFAYAFGRASVVELVSGEKRYRYRLVAGQVTQNLGYEMRARYAEDIPEPELRAYVIEL
jgi:hypothetical protein